MTDVTATSNELASRVGNEPLVTRRDVPVSQRGFEVQAVLNPAAARVGDEVVLLMRVAERPRADIDPPSDALTLELAGAEPKVVPLPRGYRKEDVIPIAFEDPGAGELRHLPVYLPKDLPGLDTSDPRGVTFVHPKLNKKVAFLTQVSHLRCAWSQDGVDFKVDDVPAIRPTEELEENGCEDARATLIDGGWFITYTAVSRFGITPCLAYTTDFRRYEKRGPILGPDNKDIALFPELRDGAFTALTRPMPSVFGHVLGIWIVYPDPRRPWGGPQPLVMPRRGYWDERHTGASTIPILTSHGWLEIYHGVDAELRYSLGGVLLDRDDPTIVLARSAEPILRPKMDYERNGLFANTIYACGHVPLDERGERIRVYYGAADSVIAAADFTVDEVIESLEPTPAARH